MEKIKLFDLKINYWIFNFKSKKLRQFGILSKSSILLKYSYRIAKFAKYLIAGDFNTSAPAFFTGLRFWYWVNDWINKYFRNSKQDFKFWWK